MKKHITTLSFLFLSVTIFFASCIRDLEESVEKLDSIGGVVGNPEFAASLISSRLSVNDILKESPSSYVYIDDDNLVHLVYRGELASLTANQIAGIPEQKFDGSIGLLPFQVTQLEDNDSTEILFTTIYNFGPPSIEIDSLIMESCALMMDLVSNFEHDVSLTMKIPGITRNGVPLTHSVALPYKGSGTSDYKKSINLSDFKMDLTKSGDKSFSQLKVQFNVKIKRRPGNPVDPSSSIEFNTNFIYNQYEVLFGYVGEVKIAPSEADTLFMDVFKEATKRTTIGNFSLANPRVRVITKNSYGIPVESRILEISTHSSQHGIKKLTGYPDPLNIPVPNKSQIGQIVVDSFELNKDNSNIENLFRDVPDKMVYQMDITLNPPGTNERNFITYYSVTTVIVDIDLPLHGSADGFIIEDEQPMDLDIENVDELEYVELRMYTENEFPVDVGLQVYFADSMNNILDSLIQPNQLFLKSPMVGSDGRITGKTTNTLDFIIPKERLDNLRKTRKAIIRGTLNTYKPGSGVQPQVKLFSDYGIFVKLGVQAKVKIDSKFEDLKDIGQ